MPPAAHPTTYTRHVLLESLGIAAVDFRCRANVEPLGAEEPNSTHGIVFVRRGVFERAHRRDALLVDANHVLFFNAGEPYRYSHPLPGGDECTILAVEGERARELVGHHAPWAEPRPERPFPIGHGLSSRRAARLHYELLGLVRSGAPAWALEDVIAELADEAVGTAYRGVRSRKTAHPSAAVQRRRRELVESAKLAINEHLDSPPSLSSLARALGCSPFHLSRTFHCVSGVSLRRYVGRLRARIAAHRLVAHSSGLTELALELGYADHSHLTNAFRREWGQPPSRFRAFQAGAKLAPAECIGTRA
jgi:AraC family transcriptional regulator